MALETGTFISDLDANNPTSTDPRSQGDDHLKLLKSTVLATFTNITGAVDSTQGELNLLNGIGQLDGVLAKTAAYTVLVVDRNRILTGDASGGAFTFTLPAAATAGAGFKVEFIKIDSSTNNVVVDGNLLETINGTADIALSVQWGRIALESDGSNWLVIGKSSSVVYAASFGVLADSSTDDLADLQTAVDFLESRGGGTLILPFGTIAVSGTLTVQGSSITVKGQGSGGEFFSSDNNISTKFLYTGAGNEPVIDVGNGGVGLFTGIKLEDFTIDGQSATGVIGVRLNQGIINSQSAGVHIMDTATSCQVLGTGGFTSFNNKWITCTFESFVNYGVDIFGDGNGASFFGCKWINTSDNLTPTASVAIGRNEAANGVSFHACSFGSTNILYHIEAIECQGLGIFGCEIEASGNSTRNATALIKLGDNASAKQTRGVSITGCRLLGNSKAVNAILLDDVVGFSITGNKFTDSFIAGSQINNSNASRGAIFANDNSGATPVSGITGLDFYVTPGGLASFGNGVILGTSGTYTPTNVVTDRSYDANATSVGELADVLGTLIADLQVKGLVS